MRARFHQTPEQFLVAAHAYMASDPLSSNVVAVFAQRVVTGTRPRHEGSLWATVEDEPGQVVGLAIHTPPHPLFLTLMPASAATVLAGALAEIGCDIRGVNGACDATVPFSEAWSAYTG
ncbi:MAG TPA: hypothetical protein VFN61_07205, partial [Acidimicrobiales bacterium]|nr:hypothetical protein [Acidimicrobiales bacterium]